LPEALVKAYQSNPQLSADRARQRADAVRPDPDMFGPQRLESLKVMLGNLRSIEGALC
jgi:hypothetical protein